MEDEFYESRKLASEHNFRYFASLRFRKQLAVFLAATVSLRLSVGLSCHFDSLDARFAAMRPASGAQMLCHTKAMWARFALYCFGKWQTLLRQNVVL